MPKCYKQTMLATFKAVTENEDIGHLYTSRGLILIYIL